MLLLLFFLQTGDCARFNSADEDNFTQVSTEEGRRGGYDRGEGRGEGSEERREYDRGEGRSKGRRMEEGGVKE